ncbi:MAG: hypothetical protein KAJ19_03700 [Gammaproteobacteria bacterium]|nr:hypothetical protein [Gammaproteobacteria bacterium]
MKTFKIIISMDNAAFEDNGEGFEVSNILAQVALRCRESGEAAPMKLRDVNGNYCGEATVEDEHRAHRPKII